jgi:3-deoxy-D-manno-octulosonic-acid transferase
VTGNMKWDTARIADEVEGADELAREMGIDRSRPLVVAGSTAPSEHALLHESVPPGTQLLCAPRKPEWFDRAADDLPGCTRRSRSETGGSHDRFLLDTIGELRAAYALADVVVIGRTFTDLGGSDMIEPVALGKATVIGPDCRNFLDAVNRLSAGPGLVQCSEAQLPDILAELLNNPTERSNLAEQGREIIRSAQGATERNATIICEMLDRTHNSPRPVRSEHAPSVAMSHSSD